MGLAVKKMGELGRVEKIGVLGRAGSRGEGAGEGKRDCWWVVLFMWESL